MSYKLNIMPLVALLNTVHTDCISVCCVTSVAPESEGKKKEIRLIYSKNVRALSQ